LHKVGCVVFSLLGGYKGFVHLVNGRWVRSVGLRGTRIPDTSITQKFFFLYSLLVSSVVEPSLDSFYSTYHYSSIAIILCLYSESAPMDQIANMYSN